MTAAETTNSTNEKEMRIFDFRIDYYDHLLLMNHLAFDRVGNNHNYFLNMRMTQPQLVICTNSKMNSSHRYTYIFNMFHNVSKNKAKNELD